MTSLMKFFRCKECIFSWNYALFSNFPAISYGLFWKTVKFGSSSRVLTSGLPKRPYLALSWAAKIFVLRGHWGHIWRPRKRWGILSPVLSANLRYFSNTNPSFCVNVKSRLPFDLHRKITWLIGHRGSLCFLVGRNVSSIFTYLKSNGATTKTNASLLHKGNPTKFVARGFNFWRVKLEVRTQLRPTIHPYPVMMAAMTMISTMFMSDIQMQLWTTNRLSLSHSVDGKGGSSSYFTMWLGTSLGTVSTYLQISYACKLVSYSRKLNLQFTV